jgi:hypothetical protein
LPKVPACESCNNEKSRLEHYLTAVLPFGGRHADALSNLQEFVPGRLAKNAKLHRELAPGRGITLTEEQPGLRVPTMTLPFDSDRLHRLFGFIAKGLLWHHWAVALQAHHDLKVVSLTGFGEASFSAFLGLNAKQRVRCVLGNGASSYEGAQGIDYPEFSIWKISGLWRVEALRRSDGADGRSHRVGHHHRRTPISSASECGRDFRVRTPEFVQRVVARISDRLAV